jgi:transposase
MNMWKSFHNATTAHALHQAFLFDKFHVLRDLGDALDQMCKSEYARLFGKDRRSIIKGRNYTLLSEWKKLRLEGWCVLRTLLEADKRPHIAHLLKERSGRLWV